MGFFSRITHKTGLKATGPTDHFVGLDVVKARSECIVFILITTIFYYRRLN